MKRARAWKSRALFAAAALAAALLVVPPARRALRAPPPLTAGQRAQASRVRILRDSYGVPHIFGQSDGDAAFGLAYAHAEDDWPTLQAILAASRGQLGLLQISKTALSNDYYAQLIDVAGQVEAQYPKLPEDLQKVLEGYAAGLNAYAALHPGEADARLLPLTGRDIAGGFAHKLPLMFDLPGTLRALADQRAGDLIEPDTTRRRAPMPTPCSPAAPPTESPGSTSTRTSPGTARWPGTKSRSIRKRAGT